MSEPVSQTTIVAAPVAQVWQALSEAEAMGAWLLPPALGATLVAEGDTLKVAMGPMRIPFAQLELLSNGQSLRLTGLPDAQVSLTFALASLGDEQTQVALQVAGLDTLPAQADEDRSEPVRAAAPRLLANLAAAVEGRDLPWPEGYLAAIFGYRREGATICGVER
ncbi:MAG: SRPBCC family protein, partial [Caldilineaceae bacterium]